MVEKRIIAFLRWNFRSMSPKVHPMMKRKGVNAPYQALAHRRGSMSMIPESSYHVITLTTYVALALVRK